MNRKKMTAGKLSVRNGTIPESVCFSLETPEQAAESLAVYDIISFDVFDTLLFRPFAAPEDLFYEEGRRLGYMDFKRIRQRAEKEARRRKIRSGRGAEVTLWEIWKVMEEISGIPAAEGMQIETECELEFCTGNPYMLELVGQLSGKKRTVIAVSDMYLPSDVIVKMLDRCGFSALDGCFVSCEYRASKQEGSLYRVIRRTYGMEKKIIHIGDSAYSDVQMAEKAGITGIQYRNINQAGKRQRCTDMSVITGSMYRGTVNIRLHNGRRIFTRQYEFGYIYGGLLAAGYCQFIRRQARQTGAQKILFFSRDGDILKQVYDRFWPEDQTVYAFWSRKAAAKLTAGIYPYDFLRRFIDHKTDQGYTLRQIFSSMELSCMLDDFCRKYALRPEGVLNQRSARCCRDYLTRHRKDLVSNYRAESEAAAQYYGKILQGCSAAAAVDIGWAGSGAVLLNRLVNHEWKLNCRITGLIAGTNTRHNAEPDAAECFLMSGDLRSYVYSQRHNREIWKFHNPGRGHNLYVEMLFGSPSAQVTGFRKGKDGGGIPVFGGIPENLEEIRQVQKGILDFAMDWKRYFGTQEGLSVISGSDAYAPVRQMLHRREYLKELECMFPVRANIE